MKPREWTWASSLSIVLGIWCVAAAIVLWSGCFVARPLGPTWEYCPQQLFAQTYCETEFIWINGHYWYENGSRRWRNGGYYRRPGHPFIRDRRR
jgi:hypothetical protein